MTVFPAVIRRALRALGRTPLFTCGAILTLALGMGGAITFFGAFHGAVLRMPPYPGAARLHRVVLVRGGREMREVSAIPVREMAAACPVVEALGVCTDHWGSPSEVEAGGLREPVPTAWIDAGMASILGIPMALGGPFQAGNYEEGEGVILSHRFWKERMGADPAVVGRPLVLAGTSQPVVGVLAPDFELPFLVDTQLLRPLAPLTPNRRGEFRFTALLRLGPGADPRAVEGVFGSVARDLERQYPRNTMPGAMPALRPLRQAMAGTAGTGFRMVCGAAALLLLLATANVAALFLNRAAARRGEMAVRLSLGASRRQLLLQGLPEGLIISGSAAGIGLVLAHQAGKLLRAWIPGGKSLHGLGHAWAHPWVTLFTVLLVLLLGLLLGAMQVLQARGLNLEGHLRAGGPQAHATRRVGDGLVVAQLALATFLLCGAGLAGRSLLRFLDQGTGISNARLWVADLQLKEPGERNERLNLAPVLRHLEARPGIARAAFARSIPTAWADGQENLGYLSIQSGSPLSVNASVDAASLESSRRSLAYDFVSEGFVEAVGLRVVRGRAFSPEDTASGRRLCVLDERAAAQFFPGGALGRNLHLGIATESLEMGAPLEVIGIVRSFRALSEDQPETPFALLPAPFSPPLRLILRSELPSSTLGQEVRAALSAEYPDLRLRKLRNLDGIRWSHALPRRQMLFLLASFGGLALILAALGLGTLVGSQVVQRTREMGIRAAIGASPGRLLAEVLRGAVRRCLAGILLGVGCSVAFSRVLSASLYGVEPTDPAALLGATAILLATALGAALVPALRAARVPPATALRAE